MIFEPSLFNFSAPLLVAGVVWTVIWLLVLAAALGRSDLDPVTRLMWVIVLIFVPFFGVLLYAFVAPARPDLKKRDPSRPLAGTPWEDNPGFVRKGPPRKTEVVP